jgi:DNA-binding transcriptional ArsR family regulator
VVLTDPRAIQALAHPARVIILEALFQGEELTATECSLLTGLSPSATSYHLKELEKWGIVEHGPERTDGRDRPWKAAGRSLKTESGSLEANEITESAILGLYLDRDRTLLSEFLQRQSDEPPEWRDAIELLTSDYWLTPNELSEVRKAIRDVLEPYRGRRRNSRPAGTRNVRVSNLSFPRVN